MILCEVQTSYPWNTLFKISKWFSLVIYSVYLLEVGWKGWLLPNKFSHLLSGKTDLFPLEFYHDKVHIPTTWTWDNILYRPQVFSHSIHRVNWYFVCSWGFQLFSFCIFLINSNILESIHHIVGLISIVSYFWSRFLVLDNHTVFHSSVKVLIHFGLYQ